MKKILLPLLLLSACVEYQAVDPSGVTATRSLGAGYMETYTLAGDGWSCSGEIRASQYEMVNTRKVPLTCSDGATGTATILYASHNRAMQVNTNVTVDYRLSNGRKGAIRV